MSATTLPYGLEWDDNIWGIAPHFTVEPDIFAIETLARRHLKLGSSTGCEVSLLAEGRYNKIYKIRVLGSQTKICVMRVALPLDMPFKVESEVATMSFLRNHTDMPIPKIYAYDSGNENELQFPWIIMEHLDGQPLDKERWKKMSVENKITLAKQLARFYAQLFEHRFTSLGSLYHLAQKPSTAEPALPTRSDLDLASTKGGLSIVVIALLCIYIPVFVILHLLQLLWAQPPEEKDVFNTSIEDDVQLGQLVSVDFITPATEDLTRGPFESTASWLSTRLEGAREREERLLSTLIEEMDMQHIQDSNKNPSFAERLIKQLDFTFPPLPTGEHEAMILHVNEIHGDDILLDEHDQLVGMVDLDFIATAPLWIACEPPRLLQPCRTRKGLPERDAYPPWGYPGEESGVNDDYWSHLSDWNAQTLREVFLNEMDRLQPEWRGFYENDVSRKEFLRLVYSAEAAYVFDRREYTWLDLLERRKSTKGVLEKDDSHRHDDDDGDSQSDDDDDSGSDSGIESGIESGDDSGDDSDDDSDDDSYDDSGDNSDDDSGDDSEVEERVRLTDVDLERSLRDIEAAVALAAQIAQLAKSVSDESDTTLEVENARELDQSTDSDKTLINIDSDKTVINDDHYREEKPVKMILEDKQ